MAMLFPLGYGGRLVTEEELVDSTMWKGLDAEFARRLLAMMKELGAQGLQYGIGGGARSTERQRNLFIERHEKVLFGGCCTYEGKRWKLKSGYAHAAPPGSSYHEDDCTPDNKCLAADMVGDHTAAERIMAKYGLLNFRNVNSEPWHFQCSDLPTGRKSFNPATMWPLKPWPLPTPPAPVEDTDMARIVRIADPTTHEWVAPEQFVVAGATIEWLTSAERRNALIASGHATLNPGTNAPYKLGRDALKHFRLIGPLPANSTLKTSEFHQD